MDVSRDLVFYTISLSGGIVLGYYTSLTYHVSLIMAISLVIILLIFSLQGIKSYQRLLLVLLFFSLGLGNIDYQERSRYTLDNWLGQKVEVGGKVKSPQDNYLTLQVENINGSQMANKFSLLVYLPQRDSQVYKWGDYVSFTGFLTKPLPATNPGGFSPRQYWRIKGISYQLDAITSGEIARSAQGIPYIVNNLRNNIYGTINDILPPKEGGILLGLLLGDKEKMDKDFYGTAQKLGIAHIFAVSGLHVGLLLTFFLAFSKLCKLPDLLILLGSFFLLVGYSLLTGFSPSVVRAAIMAFLGLVATKKLKYKDFYTILAAAAFIILIINPLSLFSISFQLSFVTTWGIFYLLPLIRNLFFFLPEKIGLVLAVPLAAQLSSLPLTVYYFNTLSFMAPFYNLLIVPLVSLLIPLLLVALLLSWLFSWLAEPFILLAGGITYSISRMIAILDQGLKGYFYLSRPPLLLLFCYYLVLWGIKEVGKLRKVFSSKGKYIVTFVLLVICIIILPKGPPPLEVAFLDVGQGDGAVIRTPYNKYIVIDGGPGANTIANYLKYKGVNRLAIAVLSHPDHDHINGLYKVMEEFRTEILLVPPDVTNSPHLSELKELARIKGTRVIEGKRGMVLKLPSGIELKVLSPDIKEIPVVDTNNASLVVNCTFGEQDFLFTGDIDSYVLKELLPALEDVEVIKVPHHGSKNSYSEHFYTQLKPHFGIISAGRGNRYGHPHGIVIKGLEEHGIQIFRTDLQGAVLVETDGRSLDFTTMIK